MSVLNRIPKEVRLKKDKRALEISWSGDPPQSFTFPAEILRVESPSAEVQGHTQSEKKLVDGKKDIEIIKLIPQGNYAVLIQFTDGHDTGIYTWEYLINLGQNLEQITQKYYEALQLAGLSRERRIPVIRQVRIDPDKE